MGFAETSGGRRLFTFEIHAMQTSLQIVQQIETLQRKAEMVKKKEVAAVVARIREAIDFYRLTAADLGLSGRAATTVAASKSDKPKASVGARYRGADGQVWSGRGPRPGWLRAALESGRSLEEFAVPGGNGNARRATATRRDRKAPTRRVAAKFQDGAGNTWSGRGSKPRWMVEALAQGRSIESMRI